MTSVFEVFARASFAPCIVKNPFVCGQTPKLVDDHVLGSKHRGFSRGYLDTPKLEKLSEETRLQGLKRFTSFVY